MEYRVPVDPYPGAVFKGKLTYIQLVATDNRLFEIRIYLSNQDMTLLEGLIAQARILFRPLPDVVRIPLEALLVEIRSNAGNNVFVGGPDKKAKLDKVKIGICSHMYAEVLEGLNPGDRAVVQGKEVFNSGQLLQSTELFRPDN